MGRCSTCTDHTPKGHTAAKIPAGMRYSIEDHVGWDLAKNIANQQDGDACIVLKICEVKVFFKTFQPSICEVVAILLRCKRLKTVNLKVSTYDEVQQDEHDQHRKDTKVDLADETFLLFLCPGRGCLGNSFTELPIMNDWVPGVLLHGIQDYPVRR